ncbi:Cytochrome c6 [Arenibacter antarcticus]|uniref:Cbb3-type cytochrome c oxidase N-terminal domain-containing protein n=1 Tax=Arenibacter antarcticus TaxID=2040469 RepID=A0ABW5VE01_9FLAO|nr:cbb3-type cytochrome c oxidase N-terminal domain-containing protein [Arenibacter sp. H213]MCM4167711.1 cytochrome C oxidase subunit III [Arenibacter sp. H213]
MKNHSPWWIRIPLVFFLIFGLMEYFVDSGDKPAFIEHPITLIFMGVVLFLLVGIELIIKSVENVMFQTLSPEAQERYLETSSKQWEWKWAKKLREDMIGEKAVAEEGEIILDHNYDGIRELDNDLPPWWVYLFYASIVFAVVYLARYHVFNGENQDMEYERAVAEAQLEIENYKKTAKGLVDANTVELLTDASDIKAGEALYTANCVACHMADGGGGIGPNLTDEYWILGGGIKNVFHTISEGGRAGKGMVAWKQILKPAEMAQVASYILEELEGTTPANPKDAEGEVWVESK